MKTRTITFLDGPLKGETAEIYEFVREYYYYDMHDVEMKVYEVTNALPQPNIRRKLVYRETKFKNMFELVKS